MNEEKCGYKYTRLVGLVDVSAPSFKSGQEKMRMCQRRAGRVDEWEYGYKYTRPARLVDVSAPGFKNEQEKMRICQRRALRVDKRKYGCVSAELDE